MLFKHFKFKVVLQECTSRGHQRVAAKARVFLVDLFRKGKQTKNAKYSDAWMNVWNGTTSSYCVATNLPWESRVVGILPENMAASMLSFSFVRVCRVEAK
jgi:hypothetical protein